MRLNKKPMRKIIRPRQMNEYNFPRLGTLGLYIRERERERERERPNIFQFPGRPTTN